MESVLAEKIQTIIDKWPAIRHRLKDILDVATLAAAEEFAGGEVVESLRQTFERRQTEADVAQLDRLVAKLHGRKWETDWATMCKEKAVVDPPNLRDAVVDFDRFVRPPLVALRDGGSPGRWRPGGPWTPD